MNGTMLLPYKVAVFEVETLYFKRCAGHTEGMERFRLRQKVMQRAHTVDGYFTFGLVGIHPLEVPLPVMI